MARLHVLESALDLPFHMTQHLEVCKGVPPWWVNAGVLTASAASKELAKIIRVQEKEKGHHSTQSLWWW